MNKTFLNTGNCHVERKISDNVVVLDVVRMNQGSMDESQYYARSQEAEKLGAHDTLECLTGRPLIWKTYFAAAIPGATIVRVQVKDRSKCLFMG